MNTRAQLDTELDHLADMLPSWLQTPRHEKLFWPQFSALAQQILDHVEEHDRPYVLQRLDAMLMANRVTRQSGWMFDFSQQ